MQPRTPIRIGPSGGTDAITPPGDTKRMYDTSPSLEKLLLIVPGADHDTSFRTAPQMYEATILRFLAKALAMEPKLAG
jgi:hypothetical protein